MTETAIIRIEKEVQAMRGEFREVRDYFIASRAIGIETIVSAHTAAIQKLEAAEERRAGARGLFDWITKSGPGILTMIIIFVAGALATKGLLAK